MNARFPLVGDNWSDDIPYRGALLIPVDGTGRILLQLRDYGPHTVHPGKWSLFGGQIEEGESPDAAVIREFHEEVGIAVPPASLRPFARTLSTPGRRRIYVFAAVLNITPKDVRLHEGAGFGFIEPQNLPDLDMIPFARAVLDRFVRETCD